MRRFLGIGAYVSVLAAATAGGSIAKSCPWPCSRRPLRLFVVALSLRTRASTSSMVTLVRADGLLVSTTPTPPAQRRLSSCTQKPSLGGVESDDKQTM